MSEELNEAYKIRLLTVEDQPTVDEFLNNFFFTSEPTVEPLNNAGIPSRFCFCKEHHSLDYLSEGLSLACVTSSGEIIAVILNSKVYNHFIECSKSGPCDSYGIKIMRLLDHLDEQITLSRKLDTNDPEMEVRIITVSDKWRNKGIGKELLKESIKLARMHGFKRIRSICTSAYTSKMFPDCGFQIVYSAKYKDCKDDGKIDFLPEKPHTHLDGVVLDL